MKPIASLMGNGRGAFRKSFLSVLLRKHADKNPLQAAIKILGNECAYCGISGEDESLGRDHLWPEASGGLDVLGNVVPCCPTCNAAKHDLPWEQYLVKSLRVKKNRKPGDIPTQAAKIKAYINDYYKYPNWSLERLLTPAELQHRKDFDLLLAALSEAAMAVAGHDKKASVKSLEPEKMFKELLAVAQKHQITEGK